MTPYLLTWSIMCVSEKKRRKTTSLFNNVLTQTPSSHSKTVKMPLCWLDVEMPCNDGTNTSWLNWGPKLSLSMLATLIWVVLPPIKQCVTTSILVTLVFYPGKCLSPLECEPALFSMYPLKMVSKIHTRCRAKMVN